MDVKPARIAYTYDVEHMVNIHKYLFGDIYEWAGTFLWHYLKGKGVDFQVALLRNNPIREKYSITKD